GLSVKLTSDSNYVVTGYTQGAFIAHDDFRTSVYNSNAEMGRAKIFLMKTNLMGDTIWIKTFGADTSENFGNSIVQTYDGGYAITGSADGYGVGWADVILIK